MVQYRLIHGIPNFPTPYLDGAMGLHDRQGRHALSEALGPGASPQLRPDQRPRQHLCWPRLNRTHSLLAPDLIQQVSLTQAETQARCLRGANGQTHHM